MRPAGLGIRMNSSRFKSDATASRHQFTITYETPDSRIPVTETFDTPDDFRKSFVGWRFVNTKSHVSKYSGTFTDVDPDIVYDATHPFYHARLDEIISHHQVADKPFEEKCIKSLECHLLNIDSGIRRWTPQDPTQQDGWRFLTAKSDIAEWGGLWEGPDRHVYFLEAKHYINYASFQCFFLCSNSYHYL